MEEGGDFVSDVVPYSNSGRIGLPARERFVRSFGGSSGCFPMKLVVVLRCEAVCVPRHSRLRYRHGNLFLTRKPIVKAFQRAVAAVGFAASFCCGFAGFLVALVARRTCARIADIQ